MSFNTTNDTAFVLSDMGSNWELWDDTLDKSESGWDTLTVTAAKDFKTSTVDSIAVAASWPIGGLLLPGRNFWITGVKPKLAAGNIWKVDVTGKGLAANRPLKVSGRTGVEQQNSDSAVVPGYGGVQRVQFLSITPTIDIEYISFTAPPTGRVGLAGTPAYAVAVRASILSSISSPLIHFPSGWVFMDLTWDKLPGVSVWLIKETWQYVFRESV